MATSESGDEWAEDTGRSFEYVEAKSRFLVHAALANLAEALRVRGYVVDTSDTEGRIFTTEALARKADFTILEGRPAFTARLPEDPPPQAPAAICGIHPGDLVWVVLFLDRTCNTDMVKRVVATALAGDKGPPANRIILITHAQVNKRVQLYLDTCEGGLTGETFTVEELAPAIAGHALVPVHTPLVPGSQEDRRHRPRCKTLATDDPQVRLLGLVPGIVVRLTHGGLMSPLCTEYRVTALPDSIRYKTAANR